MRHAGNVSGCNVSGLTLAVPARKIFAIQIKTVVILYSLNA